MLVAKAICTERSIEAVSRAIGVIPTSSPPMDLSNSIRILKKIEGADFLYVRLHGGIDLGRDHWYGETHGRGLVAAMKSQDVLQVDFSGTVVVSSSCFGLSSKFVQAFLDAGAEAFIGGHGKNLASISERVVGSDKLARGILRGLKRGMPVDRALRWAKVRLLPTLWRYADRDAFRFELVKGG